MTVTDLPGLPVPGFEDLYRMDAAGAVYSLHTQSHGKRLKTSRGYVQLYRAKADNNAYRVTDFYRALYGADPPPDALNFRGENPELTELEVLATYAPARPITTAERWQEARRVVWHDRFGDAIGQRGRAWWVLLDDLDTPLLVVPGALMIVPDDAFEREYRARVAAEALAMLEVLNTGRNPEKAEFRARFRQEVNEWLEAV